MIPCLHLLTKTVTLSSQATNDIQVKGWTMSRRNERLKTVLTLSMIFLSVSMLTGYGKDEQLQKRMDESIKQQERVIALHDQLMKEQGFTLELAKDDDGADVLIIKNTGLPAVESGAYQIYVCWLDAPAASGSWPAEKRIELIGRQSGHGKHVGGDGTGTNGYGNVTHRVSLSARHTELGDYYGRGRVCVMVVSGKASFLTNVVTVPEAPDETTVNRGGSKN